MTADHSQVNWESVPSDPDPHRDLGYLCAEWDIIRTSCRQRSHLLFLPQDPRLLEQDAFVIASESAVVETSEHR